LQIDPLDGHESAGFQLVYSGLREQGMHASSVVKPPIVPASLFGMVLGVAGLSNAWRVAGHIWNIPALIADILMVAAVIIWAVLTLLFALKWIFARAEALSEVRHPVQCCFIGLAGVSTLLIALGALPQSRIAAIILFGIGALFTFGFALWR